MYVHTYMDTGPPLIESSRLDLTNNGIFLLPNPTLLIVVVIYMIVYDYSSCDHHKIVISIHNH